MESIPTHEEIKEEKDRVTTACNFLNVNNRRLLETVRDFYYIQLTEEYNAKTSMTYNHIRDFLEMTD